MSNKSLFVVILLIYVAVGMLMCISIEAVIKLLSSLQIAMLLGLNYCQEHCFVILKVHAINLFTLFVWLRLRINFVLGFKLKLA